MKDKIILIMLITIYSSITTPLFKENIPNSLNISERNLEIAIAEDQPIPKISPTGHDTELQYLNKWTTRSVKILRDNLRENLRE